MSRIEKDEEREERIHDEAIVDAYGAEEQVMGWYYYLAESMTFPFRAKCIQEVRKSPLKLNEIITVKDMISDDDSFEMLAEIEFLNRTMGCHCINLIRLMSMKKPVRLSKIGNIGLLEGMDLGNEVKNFAPSALFAVKKRNLFTVTS